VDRFPTNFDSSKSRGHITFDKFFGDWLTGVDSMGVGVKNHLLPLTKPVAVNTDLA